MMRIENDNGSSVDRIYIRQSWLGDALMCPERARLTELHPTARKENDSAMMGTAVHTGIEAVLNSVIDPSEIASYSVNAFRSKEQDLWSKGQEINITNTEPRNWDKHIASMADAWVRDIMPSVPQGGQTEYKFATKVGGVENSLFQYELWFEGTMDYIHPTGIWDWKTAARKYSEMEKQTQNIQSAIYAESANRLNLVGYPTEFNFGVMIRNGSSTGQILTIDRKPEHGNWIITQAISIINSILLSKVYLPSERWLINDQHFLCSQRWCPVWSMCKGSFIGGSTINAEEA
jgi:hypothetical protein